MNRMFLIAIFFASCAADAHAQPKTLIMEKVTVRDPMVNNIVAGQMLKPKDWRFAGGMKWYPDTYHQVCFEATVGNPAGLEQFESLPWTSCVWMSRPTFPLQPGTNYMGSLVMPPMEPREVVEKLTIPNMRKGARVVRHVDMPEIARYYAKKLCTSVRATRSRIEYEVNGQLVEEDIYLTISYSTSDIGYGNISTIWSPVTTPFALRAAKGQLDASTPELLTIAHSGSVTPEWADAVGHVKSLFMKRMNQSIVDAGTISRKISENNDTVLNMMRETRRNRNAAEDRAAKNFSDYLRGVQEYSGGGSSYVLPSGYRNAWAGSNGYVILSNDPNYNPNVGGVANWTPLSPAR